jgi:hypothetical protein
MPRPSLESCEVWRAHYDLAVKSFISGHDSTDVFRARLKSLGFLPGEITQEVNLYWTDRNNA